MLKAKIESVLRAKLARDIEPPALSSLIERTYKYLEDCPVGYESDKVNQMIVFVAVKLIGECNLKKPLPTKSVGIPRERTKLQKAFPADKADSLLEELRRSLQKVTSPNFAEASTNITSPHYLDYLTDEEKELCVFIHNQVRGSAYMTLLTLLYEGYIENYYPKEGADEEDDEDEETFYQRCRTTRNRLLPLFALYQKEQSRLSLIDNDCDCEIPIEASKLISKFIDLSNKTAKRTVSKKGDKEDKKIATEDNVLHWLLMPSADTKRLDKDKPDLLDVIYFLSHTNNFIIKTMPDSVINSKAIYNSIESFLINIFHSQLCNIILSEWIPPRTPTASEREKMQKLDDARKMLAEPSMMFLSQALTKLGYIGWTDAPYSSPYGYIWDVEVDDWIDPPEVAEAKKAEWKAQWEIENAAWNEEHAAENAAWEIEETEWYAAMEASQ